MFKSFLGILYLTWASPGIFWRHFWKIDFYLRPRRSICWSCSCKKTNALFGQLLNEILISCDKFDHMWQAWPYVTTCDNVMMGDKCDHMWQHATSLTTCDKCDYMWQVWPHVTKCDKCDHIMDIWASWTFGHHGHLDIMDIWTYGHLDMTDIWNTFENSLWLTFES